MPVCGEATYRELEGEVVRLREALEQVVAAHDEPHGFQSHHLAAIRRIAVRALEDR